MNQEQLTGLRKLAEEAVARGSTSIPYMAATGPSTILKLLDYIETLEKDAARYVWLTNYLVGTDTIYDDAIVAALSKQDIDHVVDNAILGETE